MTENEQIFKETCKIMEKHHLDVKYNISSESCLRITMDAYDKINALTSLMPTDLLRIVVISPEMAIDIFKSILNRTEISKEWNLPLDKIVKMNIDFYEVVFKNRMDKADNNFIFEIPDIVKDSFLESKYNLSFDRLVELLSLATGMMAVLYDKKISNPIDNIIYVLNSSRIIKFGLSKEVARNLFIDFAKLIGKKEKPLNDTNVSDTLH